jgi:glutamate dehydrogenase/leucine dehydrogenase
MSPNSPNILQAPSVFSMAVRQLEIVADLIGLDDGLRRILSSCEKEFTVNFPVKMDNGTVRTFSAYRVHHNTSLGPAKGGLRYHPDVHLDETKALAMWMTWKCAIANIPYGGGKGGVTCEPNNLSLIELERLTRRLASEMSPIMGGNMDIPAPDVNTNEQIMSWFMDTISSQIGHTSHSVVTGKPVALGGTVGRKVIRLACNTTFAASVGNVCDSAFPGHPHCKSFGFVKMYVRMIPKPSLCRAQTSVMVNTISRERSYCAIVHFYREVYCELLFTAT